VHRIFGEMFHQLAAQDRREVSVIVRKAVFFRIEKVDVAMELLAAARYNAPPVNVAAGP